MAKNPKIYVPLRLTEDTRAALDDCKEVIEETLGVSRITYEDVIKRATAALLEKHSDTYEALKKDEPQTHT